MSSSNKQSFFFSLVLHHHPPLAMKKKKSIINNPFFLFFIFIHTFMFQYRRRRFILFPLVSAVAGCLLFLFAVISFLSPPITNPHLPRHLSSPSSSSVLDVFEAGRSLLEKEIVFRVPNGGGSLGRDIWKTKQSGLYYGCCNASNNFKGPEVKTHPNRYLLIATSGGLNQQRTGITDAVVAAYILNATLVVPNLDQKSYWKDKSNFSEIFDVERFISFLSRDVKVIKELPEIGGKALTPYNTRVPRKCTPKCYISRLVPLLDKKHAVQLTKFDYRLSNRLESDLQKLRCRVNYHALQFTDPILEMGKILVERMRMKSKHFIALHLRFESDMLAFSGCYYGGGDKERKELGKIRRRWKTLHKRNPDKERRQGRCPLTPEEVGLMLRALGFGNDVHIYVASGEVYGGEETLAPLKALFPNLYSKETIASKDELAPFSSYSSRMAALDFIVSDESDVFVTNNNGNMARMLAGRRRYFGHKPTIRPNAKKLYQLFVDRNNTAWEEFASRIRTFQIGFMGEPNEVKPGRGEFHENPTACICEAKGGISSDTRASINYSNDAETKMSNDNSELSDENLVEDEQELSDSEDVENENRVREQGLLASPNDVDPTSFLKIVVQPELEDMFSD